MSWKSLALSIFSLILSIGLLISIPLLFNIQTILGIIGIVLLIILPLRIRHKAIDEAVGVIDMVFAKYLIPIAMVIIGTMVVLMLLGAIPHPFQ